MLKIGWHDVIVTIASSVATESRLCSVSGRFRGIFRLAESHYRHDSADLPQRPSGVITDARVSEHLALLWKSTIRIPLAARRSRCGVANDAVALTFEAGPINGMNLDGNAGDNLLVVSGANVDLTSSGDLVAVNFQSIDASAATATQIVLDAPSDSVMSPATKMVRVTGGEGDVVVLTDAENWLMESPVIDDGQFYRVAVNQVTSEQLQLNDSSSAWQNLIEITDVDASGNTTVLDALLVIIEAESRMYSDPISSALNDPLSVGAWPGRYFDVSRDGRVTALDALRVLDLLVIIGSGEGEAALPSADVSGVVHGSAGHSWPVVHQKNSGSMLMPENKISAVQDFCLRLDWQLGGARNGSNELLVTRDVANAKSGGFSSESQLWADSVDQLLAEEIGFSEQL